MKYILEYVTSAQRGKRRATRTTKVRITINTIGEKSAYNLNQIAQQALRQKGFDAVAVNAADTTRYGYLRVAKLALLQLYGNRCGWYDYFIGQQASQCSETSPDKLEFAHVKETEVRGRGRGSYDRIFDIFTHQDCYRLLCDEHHKRFDEERKMNAESRRTDQQDQDEPAIEPIASV